MATTLYRIVATNPPTLEDFKSHLELGKVPRSGDAQAERLASGISAFQTVAQARRAARRFPMLGGFIAELMIPEELTMPEGRLIIRRTGHQQGHLTIWNSQPDVLMGTMTAVRSVG